MINLPINLDTFNFVQREKHQGQIVKNKCGRDFLYYALHFFYPQSFNKTENNTAQIDKQRIFGLNFEGKSSIFFAWTQLQFYKMPNFLKSLDLKLQINGIFISSFCKLIYALLFSRMSYEKAIKIVQDRIDSGGISGIDIAMKFGGLLDHIMFVYGYDEEYLYIFDTQQIPSLEYEKLTDDKKFYMRFRKLDIKKRWKRWSRVWTVDKF